MKDRRSLKDAILYAIKMPTKLIGFLVHVKCEFFLLMNLKAVNGQKRCRSICEWEFSSLFVYSTYLKSGRR